MTQNNSERITVAAADGFELAVRLYEPAGKARAMVLLASATGVRQGFDVVSFDYRGIGDSRRGRLRGIPGSASDWATKDTHAVLDWAAARAPGGKVIYCGHSIGGQLVALLANHGRIAALMGIGAQAGYWRHWPMPAKLGFGLLMHVFMPILTPLFGYFPSRFFGLGEPLPKGVALEWARWCRHPDYLLGMQDGPGRSHVEAFAGPVRAYSIADDGIAPERPVAVWLDWFAGAEREHRHIRPGEVGERAIGHFRVFKLGPDSPLWREMLAWIETQAAASGAGV
ncbi:MAG: alpha/beta hydrolase family protein [Alphaproteobacteria bacterium]